MKIVIGNVKVMPYTTKTSTNVQRVQPVQPVEPGQSCHTVAPVQPVRLEDSSDSDVGPYIKPTQQPAEDSEKRQSDRNTY